tara:strand:- start:1567 stop:1761 length:195 start_codon:yes stop_codon:yes gene_type:complete
LSKIHKKLASPKNKNAHPIGIKKKGSLRKPFSSNSLPINLNNNKHKIPNTKKIIAILNLAAILN